MKRKIGTVLLISTSLLVASCGTADLQGEKDADQQVVEDQTVKKVSGREIIVELKQTAKETPIRDQIAADQIESDEYKNGLYGEPSKENEEDMAVQAAEAFVAIEAVEQVYGGHEGFSKAGVLFIENQMSGAEQSGVWIGLKEIDERLDELLSILQRKVDAGEILAEPIYIYKSTHSDEDLRQVQYEVGKELQNINDDKRGIYSVSVDIISGEIEVTHDFMTAGQQSDLQKKFPERNMNFKQDGRIIATPGEPTITYPKHEFTTEQSNTGAYVTDVYEDGMLVVSGAPADFSSTGGDAEFYDATSFNYPDAGKLLKIGQRVKVDIQGPVALSYPAQGRAKYVEVLPEYKPETAKLSESQVVAQAIAIANKKSGHVLAIHSLTYDENAGKWKVVIKQEEEKYELEIEDQ